MRARVIVVALLAWGSGLPGLVGAEPLVEIKHFAICRFYFREVDTAVSKVYVANVDAIDVSQFVPADGDRRVSRTPVISWDVADGGALYYVLRIWRDGRLVLLDDVFENGTGLDKSSFAVPSASSSEGLATAGPSRRATATCSRTSTTAACCRCSSSGRRAEARRARCPAEAAGVG